MKSREKERKKFKIFCLFKNLIANRKVKRKIQKNLTDEISCVLFYEFLDANLETMSSTPQKGFSVAAWNKLQRDLNSPSASCRMRAIRAIK